MQDSSPSSPPKQHATRDDRHRDVRGEILCTVAHEQDIAVPLVEHDVPMVLQLCSMISVLDFGEVIATGTRSRYAVIAPCRRRTR